MRARAFRLPLIPTIVVAIAVAAMIALGVWQLQRREEKQAALATFAANQDLPAMAFPRLAAGDAYLFRRAAAHCLEVIGWSRQGGRDATGGNGWRQIAECRTGAEGPVLLIDMGVSKDPMFKPQWSGGSVTGTIAQAPDHRPMFASMFDRSPRGLMLVSDAAAPGLTPSAKPDIANVPNNHLAYAVQWFLFAGVALVIYLLALWYRQRPRASDS